MKRLRDFAAVGAALCVTLSACGSASTKTESEDGTDLASLDNEAEGGGGSGLDSIEPFKTYTGSEIVDALGLNCPYEADPKGRPEVLGVALGMSVRDAVSVLACRQGEAELSINATFNPSAYVSPNDGIYALKAAYQRLGGIDAEAIDVSFAGPRGQERVVAVWRAVYPHPENAPLIEKIEAQMTQKYGSFDVSPGLGIHGIVKMENGARVPLDALTTRVCLDAVEFNALAVDSDGSDVERAAEAGCGETVLMRLSYTSNPAVASQFRTLLFDPSYGASLYAESRAERDADDARRDAQAREQAGQRDAPEI
jgi:hypothetical protein